MESSACCRFSFNALGKKFFGKCQIITTLFALSVLANLLYFMTALHSPTTLWITVPLSEEPPRSQHLNCSAELPYPFQEMLATRQAQYKRFWDEHPDFKTTRNKHHKFYTTRELSIKTLGYDPGAGLEHFTHQVEKRERDGFVVLEVQEHNQGNASKGGSSFHAVVKSGDMIQTCGFQDFFNGTYLVKCPMYTKCVNLTLKLHFLDFRQYQGVVSSPPHDRELFSGEVCLQNSCVFAQKPAARWQEDRGNRSVWHENGRDYPISSAEFCRLVDVMTRDRFYMIGASHMEHQYRYIMVTCMRHLRDLDKRLIYTPARYASNVIKAIEGLISNNTNKKCKLKKPSWKYVCGQNSTSSPAVDTKHFKNVIKSLGNFTPHPPCRYDGKSQTGVLFQLGSWDLSYNGLRASLALMPSLDRTLKRLALFQQANPSVTIAAMSPPSAYSRSYGQTRNNDIIQLFGHSFREVTEKHGFRYIDSFDMMYPLHHRKAPGDGHYLFCKGSKCRHDVVGLVVLQRAIQALANTCA